MSLTFNPQALRVVSMRHWIADELRSAAATRGLETIADYGLDAPLSESSCVWWMPASHAARLMRAGVSLTLTSPPSNFLSALPLEFSGRKVETSFLKDAKFEGSGWAKAVDIKHDSLPAKHYRDLSSFLRDAQAILPETSLVQMSKRTLDIRVEYRFFIVDGQVASFSPYLAGDLTFYDGLTDDGTGLKMLPFVTEALIAAKEAGVLCPSFTLDVADTSEGFCVLEANPSWCSAFYGADTLGVVDALVAAARPQNDFAWRPDPFYQRQAERLRPLARSEGG